MRFLDFLNRLNPVVTIHNEISFCLDRQDGRQEGERANKAFHQTITLLTLDKNSIVGYNSIRLYRVSNCAYHPNTWMTLILSAEIKHVFFFFMKAQNGSLHNSHFFDFFYIIHLRPYKSTISFCHYHYFSSTWANLCEFVYCLKMNGAAVPTTLARNVNTAKTWITKR